MDITKDLPEARSVNQCVQINVPRDRLSGFKPVFQIYTILK